MYLRMKNNHLQKFPSDLLNNLDVRHLMAHKCNMIDVDTNAFSSLHNKIQSIDFSKNKFKEVIGVFLVCKQFSLKNCHFRFQVQSKRYPR